MCTVRKVRPGVQVQERVSSEEREDSTDNLLSYILENS